MQDLLSFDQLPEAVSELSEKLDNIERLLLTSQAHHKNGEQEEFLTVQETAQFLKLTVPTVYSKVSKRELPVMKRGKRLYFSSIELLNYLKEGRKKTYGQLELNAKKLFEDKSR